MKKIIATISLLIGVAIGLTFRSQLDLLVVTIKNHTPAKSQSEIKIGDVFLIDNDHDIPIKNPSGADVDDFCLSHLKYDEVAMVYRGGTFKVVGFLDNQCLVKYSKPLHDTYYRTLCTAVNGTLTTLSTEDLRTMDMKYCQSRNQQESEKANIAKIIGN